MESERTGSGVPCIPYPLTTEVLILRTKAAGLKRRGFSNSGQPLRAAYIARAAVCRHLRAIRPRPAETEGGLRC
jgi:hypothetical protein